MDWLAPYPESLVLRTLIRVVGGLQGGVGQRYPAVNANLLLTFRTGIGVYGSVNRF